MHSRRVIAPTPSLLLTVAFAASASEGAVSKAEAPEFGQDVRWVERSVDGAGTWTLLDPRQMAGKATGMSFLMADQAHEWVGVVVDRDRPSETLLRISRDALDPASERIFDENSNRTVTMS